MRPKCLPTPWWRSETRACRSCGWPPSPPEFSGLLAACVPAFCQAHPDIVLRVDEIDGRQILSLAARDEFDIFVCRTPEVTPDGWAFVPVVEDEHAIMAAPTHPLAGRTDVTLGDLRACTWLMPPSGVPAEALIAALFADGPMPPHFQMPTRSRTLNWAAVTEMGLVTTAPASIFRAELRSGTLVRINYPLSGAMPPLGLLLPDMSTGPAMDRFVAFVAPRKRAKVQEL